jgi:hypothetical protein
VGEVASDCRLALADPEGVRRFSALSRPDRLSSAKLLQIPFVAITMRAAFDTQLA